MTPARGLGTSTSALAISIFASVSFSCTRCPGRTHHSTNSASSRPSPKSGRRNWFELPFALATIRPSGLFTTEHTQSTERASEESERTRQHIHPHSSLALLSLRVLRVLRGESGLQYATHSRTARVIRSASGRYARSSL